MSEVKMSTLKFNDSVHFFIDELRSRVVAESGIPSDRFHLGKLILRSLKDDPEFISQIDAANHSKETCGSILKRSIQCAKYFKSLGLKRGDVLVLVVQLNHLDLAVPFYAALYLGISIAPIDSNTSVDELETCFKTISPILIISQCDKSSQILTAVKKSNTSATILTFDDGSNHESLSDMLKKHENDTTVDEFRAEDFDPEETIAILGATSGTTDNPKYTCSTHKNFAATGHYFWSFFRKFPTPNKVCLLLSSLRWITGYYLFIMSPIMRITRLQTSQIFNEEHIYEMINTYKPSNLCLSTSILTTLIKSKGHEQCDFSCFENISTGGSDVPVDLIKETLKLTPNTLVRNVYGQTEANFLITHADSLCPLNSCGKPLRHIEVRLIDVTTKQEITEPNIPGELEIKGPSVFKGYFKNPKENMEAFTKDGWLKTGDVLYRDDDWNFYYVERIKLYLKYNREKISPVEVESVIIQHPGVLDVAITGVRNHECGELITACVVRRPGSYVTAQQIKDIVKDSLPDSRQLRGGVIFLDKMPLTATTKVDRRKLREMVQQMARE